MRGTLLCLVAVCLLVLALPHDVAADCRDRITLSPPAPAGESIDGVGRAEIRSTDSQQIFTVVVDVDLPEGSPLYVFANGEPVGMITFVPGSATLQLSDANGEQLPSGVDPVCAIGPVTVTDGDGTTLLVGSF
jgi:hypothetical protein